MTLEGSIVRSHKESVFSVFFILLGFFWNDVINYSFETPLGASLMVVDLLFFLSLFCAIKEVNFFKQRMGVFLFCFVIVVYALFGLTRFGMKALSDSRQYYHFFFLFLGFSYAKNITEDRFIPTLFKIILSIAIGSFILFVVEKLIGHGFGFAIANSEETDFGFLEDQRGVRILGSTETFNLCIFVLFAYFFRKKIKFPGLNVIAIIFSVAVLITQNRTPLLAAVIGLAATQFIFLRIRKGRLHRVFIQIGFVCILIMAVYLLDYYQVFPLFSSLKSAMSVDNDEIGTTGFRLLGALGAIQIFLSNVLFGEGLGKGWQLDFGFSILNIPPHNQYASILAKFGLVGFAAFLFWMNRCYFIIKRFLHVNYELFGFSMVLFLSEIPYGFGFDFHPFLPFYMGMLLTRKVK